MAFRTIETKIRNYFTRDNHANLIQLGIIFSLFLISFTARYVMNYWFTFKYGITRHFSPYGFCIETYPYISKEGFYWEAYHDASEYYQFYLYAFRFQNWDIYGFQPWPLSGYVYGPLFVFFLVLVSYFVQLFNPHMSIARISWEAVKVTPMIFDSITTVFVYLIIKDYLRNRIKDSKFRTEFYSIFGAIAFLIMPVVFFYNDVLYLNSYMFTSFTIISMYFMNKKRYELAGGFLIMAILTKIVSLFFLPLWMAFLFRINRRKFFEFLEGALFIGITISIPWIYMYPVRFFGQQLWPGKTFNTHFSINPVWILWSTTPFHAFLYWDRGRQGFWYKLAVFYYNLNNHYIPLFSFLVICYVSMLLIGPYLYKNHRAFLTYQAMFAIGIHLFLSRGNYKYYDPFFMPFIIIALFVWAQRFDYEWLTMGSILISLTWIFIVNIWILINIKWLHMFYVFLLFITMLVFFDNEMHLCFIRKSNYKAFKSFLIELYKESKTLLFETKNLIVSKVALITSIPKKNKKR